jgi:DNA-binding GntR family transcriptional regulator
MQGDAVVAATGQHLYLQVADDLRSQIATGRLNVDDEIPSTAELAEQHGVSRGVAQAAVRLLKEEGLLIGQTGKAVYVRATPETAAAEAAALKTVEEQLADLREEVHGLAEQQPADVIAKIDELKADVGRLQADLRTLYDRTGQPYPDESTPPAEPTKRRQRKTS